MGRTFKCMFFIPNDLLFLLQEKKENARIKALPCYSGRIWLLDVFLL